VQLLAEILGLRVQWVKPWALPLGIKHNQRQPVFNQWLALTIKARQKQLAWLVKTQVLLLGLLL
jgi:hypothetical protein